MPGMSGLDLLPKAKALRPDVPVIMITAYGDAETKRTALEKGAEASRGRYRFQPSSGSAIAPVRRRMHGRPRVAALNADSASTVLDCLANIVLVVLCQMEASENGAHLSDARYRDRLLHRVHYAAVAAGSRDHQPAPLNVDAGRTKS
jgi:CheY-like chemotaxis protein